jgi:hypothetical protein
MACHKVFFSIHFRPFWITNFLARHLLSRIRYSYIRFTPFILAHSLQPHLTGARMHRRSFVAALFAWPTIPLAHYPPRCSQASREQHHIWVTIGRVQNAAAGPFDSAIVAPMRVVHGAYQHDDMLTDLQHVQLLVHNLPDGLPSRSACAMVGCVGRREWESRSRMWIKYAGRYMPPSTRLSRVRDAVSACFRSSARRNGWRRREARLLTGF